MDNAENDENTLKSQKKTKSKENQDIEYSKEAILASSMFSRCIQDKLRAILKDDEKYTLQECNEILENENKRVIK